MSRALPFGWPSARRLLTFVLVAFVVALSLATVGCAGFGEAREDSKNTESAIKTELGVDATVTFRMTSGTAGKKTFVTVRLKTTPTGDAASIKTKVDDIVNHTFRSHVDLVDVAL